VNIETTWNDFSVHEITDQYFHSNHFISPKFMHQPLPKFPKSSLTRLRSATKYLRSHFRQEVKVKEILLHPQIHQKNGINPTLCTGTFRANQKHVQLHIFKDNQKTNDHPKISRFIPFIQFSVKFLVFYLPLD
jgi:hypothetical protein